MERLNICIDIDGTITEPYFWLSRANEYFNTNIKPKEVTIYDIPDLLGVERTEYDEFYKKFGKSLHIESKIRMGASQVINKLYAHHNIHFVTAREEEMKVITFEWLKRHQVSMDSLIMTGCNDKVKQANDLQCDLFIEDRYENAIQLSLAGFEILLMDCSYNQGFLPSNVKRVKNWYEIARIIESRTQHIQKNKPA